MSAQYSLIYSKQYITYYLTFKHRYVYIQHAVEQTIFNLGCYT